MVKLIRGNENGFVLVWGLVILAMVALLGASSISSSILEEQMAVNDVLHKQTFYYAEGGTEVGISLLKHNIACIDGFGTSSFYPGGTNNDGGINVTQGSEKFWISNNLEQEIPIPSDTDRDFYYYTTPNQVASASAPHTNVKINGRTHLMKGAALQQLAGYERVAKSVSAGGAFLAYDIKSQHVGTRESASNICIQFRVDSNYAETPSQQCMYSL